MPALPATSYNKLARKYAPKGAGAVFTFSLKGGYDAGVNLVSNLKLFSHLANVGDTRSLVIHPASTTHSQLDDAAQGRSPAPAPDVVRLLDRHRGQGRPDRGSGAGAERVTGSSLQCAVRCTAITVIRARACSPCASIVFDTADDVWIGPATRGRP